MKSFRITFFLMCSAVCACADEIPDTESIMLKHAQGSGKLADEQDELSADVQQLVLEQTVPQVIKLLDEVEVIMDETTDYLTDRDTGGKTIAAQTEIIEKIHQAAKAKQDQQGSGDASGAMMEMMERMMGKKAGQGEGKKPSQPGDKSGQGQTGDSDSDNTENNGINTGVEEERKIPKAAGNAGKSLPTEFQEALDAYNRGLEGKSN